MFLVILENDPFAHERNVYSAVVWCHLLCVCNIQLVYGVIQILYFGCSICYWSGILKYYRTVYFFQLLMVPSYNLGLCFWEYMFTIVLSSWWMILSSINIWCHFFVSLTLSDLKTILSDTNIAMPTHLHRIFPFFIFNLFVSRSKLCLVDSSVVSSFQNSFLSLKIIQVFRFDVLDQNFIC